MMLASHVKTILMDHWDPIGIRNVPKAKRQYDPFVTPILRDVIAGASAEAIAERLFTFETEAMSLGGDRDRALYVAEKLLAARDAMSMERDVEE
jgi:hypothetical protein